MLPRVVASHSKKPRRDIAPTVRERGLPGARGSKADGYFVAGDPLPLAPGAEPPMNTLRPSRYSTKTPTPLLSPLLAPYPNSFISVPTGRLAFVMPFLK